ncbi:divergent polysaccharide deacetylase family protein [Teredinibacter franksiae]|jgi:Uncharacterized protein conserved in bacteria|uniref:divergent polysaccharide deacetylase family protein n=1 Tax=Teredinibacter franksiae TaxID=2761453 RepID=UPI0016255B85|nr:divergent polysaccharide deacetylase family protein [Teredinibacter franksiae]
MAMNANASTNATTDNAWQHSCPVPHPNTQQPMVAIIIDDLGYQMGPALHLLELHRELTFSIIPFTPYGRKLATLAHQQQREVMVHAPMETLHEIPWEQALLAKMDQRQIRELSQQMLAAVPNAQGLNNHGGSLLTQRTEHMGWLMDELKTTNFYFVDSRTSAASVASRSAQNAGVPQMSRDVFLDNQRNTEAILEQLNKLEQLARKYGHAVGIGHPYPETLAALESKLPELSARGVQIVRISTLIKATTGHAQYAFETTQPQLMTVHPEAP